MASAKRSTSKHNGAPLVVASEALQSAPEILETIREGYIALGADRRILYVNQAAEALLGVPRHEVIGRIAFDNALEPLRDTAFEKAFASALDSGMPCRMEEHIDRPPYLDWYRMNAMPAQGGVAIFFHMVTDRKRLEETQRRRSAFRRLITRLSTEFIHVDSGHIDSQINKALKQIGEFTDVDRAYVFTIHDDGNLMDVTHEWCAKDVVPDAPRLQNLRFDYCPWLTERVKEHETVAINDVNDLPAEAEALQAALRPGGIQAVALVPVVYGDRLMGIAGFDLVRGATQWQDETVGLLRIVGDIFANALERKRAEQERDSLQQQLMQAWKMDSIGWLAGGIAHDFNNMLSPIIGYAEMMMRSMPHEDPNHRRAANIHSAAERARDLTAQLLAFSRKQVLSVQVVNLAREIERFAPILRRIVREDIEIDFFLPESAGNVRVDISQLQQIAMNLVINAQEAMPLGGHVVVETASATLDDDYASTHLGASPGHYAALIVTDTGFGMPPDVQKRIFDPFYSRKRRAQGTGLGLSTVFGIVKQHGGNIWVYSEMGKGSTFKVYLPAIDEPAERSAASEQPTAEPAGGGETVLVVEDDPMVRNVTVDILEGLGYQTLAADGADEAFRLAAGHGGAIDLLVTDVVLPQTNGREIFVTLAKSRPGLKALFMSGYTDNVIAHHGILDKDIHFLQKPFAAETLAAKVREALEG